MCSGVPLHVPQKFFELAVLFVSLAKPPFYGYGLCNKRNQTGIKFNELGWLNLNLPLSAIRSNFKCRQASLSAWRHFFFAPFRGFFRVAECR